MEVLVWWLCVNKICKLVAVSQTALKGNAIKHSNKFIPTLSSHMIWIFIYEAIIYFQIQPNIGYILIIH